MSERAERGGREPGSPESTEELAWAGPMAGRGCGGADRPLAGLLRALPGAAPAAVSTKRASAARRFVGSSQLNERCVSSQSLLPPQLAFLVLLLLSIHAHHDC